MKTLIETAQTVHDEYPLLNWLTIIGSAALAWLQPLAALVAIGWGCLQAYIAWQKYRHWKKTKKGD